MTTRVWITRTQPTATRSADNWRKAGFEPVIAPLLSVEPVPSDTPIPDEAELIFTSANAVSHCGLTGDGRRVYTVGDATAAAARKIGFSNIISGDKDWKALSQLIEKTRNPLIHLSGEVVRGDLVGALRKRGLQASRQIIYRTVPVTSWPVELDRIDAVALYSPLASETLMALPARDLSSLTAYCLSENVAEPLSGISVRVAKTPSEMSLIACSLAQDE